MQKATGNIIILSILYTVKSVPHYFFLLAMPVIMRTEGFSLTTIGLMQLVNLPWLLKFLWAPLVDNLGVQKNHYKRWTMYSGILCAASLLCLSTMNLTEDLVSIVIIVLTAALLYSTQDMALNSLYILLFNYEDRSRASSIKIFSLFTGGILGSGIFLILYNHFGWKFTLMFMGILMMSSLLLLSFLDEKKRSADIGRKTVTFRHWITFFKNDGMKKWSVLMFCYSLGQGGVYVMMKPFFVDRGLAVDTIAFLVGIYGMIIGALGGLISSLFRSFFRNRKNALMKLTLFGPVSLILFVFISAGYDGVVIVYITLFVFYFLISLTSAAVNTMVMDFSRTGRESLDYSLQMTILHLGGLFIGSVSGFIIDFTGYTSFFILECFIGILYVFLMLILLRGSWIADAQTVILNPDNAHSSAELNPVIAKDSEYAG